MALVLASYGIEGTNLYNADYAVNGLVQSYLLQNPVLINDDRVSIIVNDPDTGIQSSATTELSLDANWLDQDTQNPTVPENVRALQSAANEVIVVWEPSQDNLGINAYHVYRDATLIETTPYPVASDSNLQVGSTHTYTVVAVDTAGNRSVESAQQALTISSELNTAAPPAPFSLNAQNMTTSLITLTWQLFSVDAVSIFEIQRSTVGSPFAPLTSVTASVFTDISVQAGTEYCYQVVAVGIAGNRSEPSEAICATTLGVAISVNDPPTTAPNGDIPDLSRAWSSDYGDIFWDQGYYGTPDKTLTYTGPFERDGQYVVTGTWGRLSSSTYFGGFEFIFDTNCSFEGVWWVGDNVDSTSGWSGSCE